MSLVKMAVDVVYSAPTESASDSLFKFSCLVMSSKYMVNAFQQSRIAALLFLVLNFQSSLVIMMGFFSLSNFGDQTLESK